MLKKCDVKFTNQTLEDLRVLPKMVINECFEKLEELENNIHLGKALENLDGINLEGYYAIYFCEAKYRIVYAKTNDSYEIVNVDKVYKPIAELIAIGKRNNKEVYQEAYKRVLEKTKGK